MRTNLKGVVIAGLMVGMAMPGGNACVNTAFSQKHDMQITGDAVKIIMGQFAQHGPAFWEEQLSWNKFKSANDPKNSVYRNDMAVALLKLKRYDEAQAQFEKIEATTPGLYKTYSNMGVLFKKTKNFREAAVYTRKALKVKPEGHLGLGDYYLRMLSWRAAVTENPDKTPVRNFLGIKYADGPAGVKSSTDVNETFLKTLIIADHNFPDVYVVYGDLMAANGETEMAFRCYSRAKFLNDGTTPKDVIDLRLESLQARVLNYDIEFKRQQQKATNWVAVFQNIEAPLAQIDHEVDFDTVKAKMKSKGLTEPVFTAILPEKKGFISKVFGF